MSNYTQPRKCKCGAWFTPNSTIHSNAIGAQPHSVTAAQYPKACHLWERCGTFDGTAIRDGERELGDGPACGAQEFGQEFAVGMNRQAIIDSWI